MRPALAAAACSSAQLYSYPAAGDTFAASSSAPITFKWDPSCVTASANGNVDLTLYAPYSDSAVISVRPPVFRGLLCARARARVRAGVSPRACF